MATPAQPVRVRSTRSHAVILGSAEKDGKPTRIPPEGVEIPAAEWEAISQTRAAVIAREQGLIEAYRAA